MSIYAARPAKTTLISRILSRAPTYWQYLRERPAWLVMFVFARILVARKIERLANRASFRSPAPAPNSAFGDLALNEIVDELVRDGVSARLKLPASMVANIVEFAETTPCYSRDRQNEGFLPHRVQDANRKRGNDIIAGHYFEAVEECLDIVRLSKEPALISVARGYLGCEPVLIRTRLWWSFPAKRVSDADLHAAAQEKYHFDLNGWRTLKFFFYLTRTGEQNGAHRCIPGSHRRRRLSDQFTPTVGRSTEELEAYYGERGFLSIIGDAGFGFAEDPFLFHTGSLCQDAPRLILEIEFGSTDAGPSYRYGRLG